MKRISFILILLLVSLGVMAQQAEAGKTRAERKAERKEERAKRDKEQTETTEKAIASGNYVLKADQLRDKYGRTLIANPDINFVAKRGDEAIVQFGNDSGIGYNGVGGLTLRGRITNYSVTRGKKNGDYIIVFTVTGTFGNITVDVHSNITGEYADARVESTWGNRLSFTGNIVPILNSRIFTGESY